MENERIVCLETLESQKKVTVSTVVGSDHMGLQQQRQLSAYNKAIFFTIK